MPLKISDPVKQVGVLNHFIDQLELRVRAIELGITRTTAIASGTSALSPTGGGSTPSGGSGSGTANFKVIVSNYTIQPGDQYIRVNSSGPVTIQLSATSAQKGQVWRIKNSNTGLVTLVPQSSSSVENLAFVTLPLQMQSFDIVYDGANFWIF